MPSNGLIQKKVFIYLPLKEINSEERPTLKVGLLVADKVLKSLIKASRYKTVT
jgi:hypothetical protein